MNIISLPFYDKMHSPDFISMGFDEKKYRRYLLLCLMEKYANGAIIQWNRIQFARVESFNSFNSEEARTEMEQYSKEIEEAQNIEDFKERFNKLAKIQEEHNKKFQMRCDKQKVNHSMLFLDIHFYFICCDKVRNIFLRLKKIEKNPELDNLWDELHLKLDPLHSARSELEHIDEKT